MIAREIWRIISQIRASGIATVIVDKNYRAVASIADRAVVLVKGKVVFDDDARKLIGSRETMHEHLGV